MMNINNIMAGMESSRIAQCDEQHLPHEAFNRKRRRRRTAATTRIQDDELMKKMTKRNNTSNNYIKSNAHAQQVARINEPKQYRQRTESVALTLFAISLLINLVSINLIKNVEGLQQQQQQQQQQQSANTPGGLQQTMAQMLQVFNGNDSNQLEANHFKLLEVVHQEWLLVGGRNVVYNLSLSSMREQRRIEWPASDEDVRMCQMKGKSPEQCQNYIRVLKAQTDNQLLVCGTNAYKPRCRTYLLTAQSYELISEEPGEGFCPYLETANVTTLLTDGGDLYSATAAQFSGIDGLIYRRPLRTEQFNPKQLNSPNFVSSFKYGPHVYFLFREIALESINCGKQIYSRIARVCAGDTGGQTRSNRDRWTSFAKVRLNCSIPGDFPFYFDEIQASTGVLSSAWSGRQQAGSGGGAGGDQLFYAVFTTPLNSIGGSAVCAFRMADVRAAFDGPFKSQADSNSNWLPVQESRIPAGPRPGSCVNDTRRLPDETINFIKENPLMDQAVAPVWSQPLITMASLNFRFTQIQVDVQVETPQVLGGQAMRADVIFVSTDDGRVFKLINTYHLLASSPSSQLAPSASFSPIASSLAAPPTYYPHQATDRFGSLLPSAAPQTGQQQQQPQEEQHRQPTVDVSSTTIVIEELHLFDSRTPILNMLLYYPPHVSAAHQVDGPHSVVSHLERRPKLLVLSGKQLKAIPLSRCERAQTCADCLALHDPYCAWDGRQSACLALGRPAALAELQPNWRLNHQQKQHMASVGALQANPQAAWFPANAAIISAGQQPNNHTLGWWSSCPTALLDPQPPPPPQQVGAPYRSLFSSHLQVPSRFDYQSGHHLSHTSMISLSQPPPPGPQSPLTGAQTGPLTGVSRQQPASECLTFCGGVYMAPQQSTGTNSGADASSCADYVQQHYMGANSFLQSAPNLLGGQVQQTPAVNMYTSDHLYLAVIICALSGLILGLLFGFAIGKTSLKRDSSICSSTFDETNLYMASTGSHHGPNGGALFAAHQNLHQQQHPHPHLHQARTLHHQHPLLSHSNGYQLNGQPLRPAAGGSGGLYDANQCLLSDTNTYGNQQHQQQQMLLALGAPMAIQPNVSTAGRSLPPIPRLQQQQQQPLVNTANTHINQSQLTPPNTTSSASSSASSSSSSGRGSDSSKQPGADSLATCTEPDKQQMYLNQQQASHLHQSSFSNSSSKGKIQLQQLPNNKIYL